MVKKKKKPLKIILIEEQRKLCEFHKKQLGSRGATTFFYTDSRNHLNKTLRCVSFYPPWRPLSEPGSRGSLRLARMWWDGDKYPGLPRINNPERNHNGARRGSDWTGKQNITKKGAAARKRGIVFQTPVCLPATCWTWSLPPSEGVGGSAGHIYINKLG